MKKKDYMFLPKKRLAELLEERDNLEEKIEDIVVRKFLELYKSHYPINIPNNPFQPISVLYGCPTDIPDVIYRGDKNVTTEQT